MCYLCTKAVNETDAFQYVIRGDEIWHLDGRNPSFTDLKKGSETFYIVTMPMCSSLEEFSREAKRRSSGQTFFIPPGRFISR